MLSQNVNMQGSYCDILFSIFQVIAEEEQSSSKKIKIDRRKSFYLYRKLSPYSRYEFRVAAYNKYSDPCFIGRCRGTEPWLPGVFSDPSPTYTTLADKPMRSVTGVEGGGGKTGDLVISWDPLPEQEHNAPGVYYRCVTVNHICPTA